MTESQDPGLVLMTAASPVQGWRGAEEGWLPGWSQEL